MCRLAVCMLLVIGFLPSLAIAEVVVTHDGGVPTPSLPGFRTVTVTAISTVPGETISAVDFYGNPDDNNPATARGFFGQMNQELLLGQPTVFDLPSLGPIDPPPVPAPQDSHFLVREWTETGIDIVVPAGFANEGSNFLRAAYAATEPIGQSIKVAQLVIPNAANGIVHYRGIFAIMQGGVPVDTPEIVGSIVTVPEPAAWCLLVMALITFGCPRVRWPVI